MIQTKIIIALVSIIAISGFEVWLSKHNQTIGYNQAKLEYDAALAKSEQEARVKEQSLAKQVEDAQNESNHRLQIINDISRDSANSSARLQSALDQIRATMPRDSSSALTEHTAALTAILGECQRDYREMAENADRHYSDYKTLSDAWPK